MKERNGNPVTAYLSLGSNSGSREKNLEMAIREIGEREIALVNKISHIYETEPVEAEGDIWFLNACAEIETHKGGRELLDELKKIESAMGRNLYSPRGSARVIDIDILLFGSQVIKDAFIEIPHPRMHLRRFVLKPLSELCPNVIHPVLGSSVSQLLSSLEDPAKVRGFGHFPIIALEISGTMKRVHEPGR